MAARKPKIVVPGHLDPRFPTDASSITHTRNYLQHFENELAVATDGAALIAAMKKRYPEAGLGISLEIGAKVAKGEMKWGGRRGAIARARGRIAGLFPAKGNHGFAALSCLPAAVDSVGDRPCPRCSAVCTCAETPIRFPNNRLEDVG